MRSALNSLVSSSLYAFDKIGKAACPIDIPKIRTGRVCISVAKVRITLDGADINNARFV